MSSDEPSPDRLAALCTLYADLEAACEDERNPSTLANRVQDVMDYHLRAILPGEQPGEAVCLDGDATVLDGWCVHIGFRHRSDTPAPVVPDSPNVRERVVEQVRLSRIADQAWQNRRNDAEFQEEAERLADAVLAVVGQGVTAEQMDRMVDEALREYRTCDHDGRALVRAMLTAALAEVGIATVRPTGQEESDG